jgi:hypothetical protein
MARRKPRRYVQEDPLAEWLAWLMDDSIRVGPWTVGLDGLIGLIPGIGDMTAAMVSAFIIARAMQSGVPKSAIIRMVINVGLDSLAGAVPFLGDIFDFAYKSNRYNLEIYRQALRDERQPLQDWLFILLVCLILLGTVLLPIAGLIYLIGWLGKMGS